MRTLLQMSGWLMSLSIVFSTHAFAQDQELRARGVVQPNARTTMAVDIVARITQLPFRDGERFKKGDTLIAFDCRRYQAEYKAVQAGLRAEMALYKQAETLKSHNAGGATAVTVGKAKTERAAAEAEALAARIEQCLIKAPYGGRIVERLVQPYDLPPANEPLLKIVDDSRLEIEVLVPSLWLQWLKAGSTFEFEIEEVGKSFPARVLQVAAVVDPVSQTIKITGAFDGKPQDVLPGMGGIARFRGSSGTNG